METNVPKTPMRRFFRGNVNLTRPSLALGKRGRDATLFSNISDHRTSLEPSAPRPCLAIQQHDKPLDAVVITTLSRYPFCCHEDLLLMSRQQLVEAATLFNDHLPYQTRIDCSESASEASIRYNIEVLVGILPQVPGAPKAVKSRNGGIMTMLEDDSLPSPPSSPLSKRMSHRRGMKSVRLLEKLEEEDEGYAFIKQRTVKKRKVSPFIAEPTRFHYEGPVLDMDISPVQHLAFSSTAGMFSPNGGEGCNATVTDMDTVFLSPPRNLALHSTPFTSRVEHRRQNHFC